MGDIVAVLALAIILPAISNWRLALLLTLSMGFAQDVLRKLTPGEPVVMVLLFAPVFAIAALGLLMRGGSLSLGPMFVLHPSLRAPIVVFLCIIAAQVLLTIANTGSVMLAGLGIMIYLLPFVALMVAMYFANNIGAVAGALKVYIFSSVLFSLGVYLNVLGYQEGILDSVGVGLFVYPDEGGVFKLPSGFFRAAETAAWHGATAAALAAMLVMLRMFPGGPLLGIAVISILIGVVVLTGRRKMVVELLFFAVIFATLLAVYGGRGMRLVALLGCLCTAVYLGQLLFVQEQSGFNARPYVSRYATVAQEVSGRLEDMTVGSFRSVVARNGWTGSGAGTTTQGAAQFGGGTQLVGFGAEGGIARLLAELGVHGLLAGLWLAVGFAQACHASIRDLRQTDRWRWSLLSIGLGSLLIANIMVFATAGQVFGDPFVLLVLGLLLGFVLRARGQVHAPQHTSVEDHPSNHPSGHGVSNSDGDDHGNSDDHRNTVVFEPDR